jgi:hypothetical protein
VVTAVTLPEFSLQADSTWVYAVQVSATVQESPPAITLQWQPDPYGANNYAIYRKNKDAGSWNSVANLSGSALNWTDGNVAEGGAYEYQIVKSGSLGYTGYGYIYAGIKAPLVERRGKVLLIVDNSMASPLASELTRLQNDLVGDGWTVIRHNVGRNDSPASVKQLIVSDFNADRANVNTVFLFGHVPIFRCGNLNVDGHQARPMPADTFYADVDGWGNPDTLPSDAELMVGRVDMWNLPVAGSSEVELLRNYLNKDHNWRHKRINVARRALMGNRFGDFNGEAFAASGFRNFDQFVGAGNIVIANEQDAAPADRRWSSMLSAGGYLWAYGCGGGSYTSMSGLGTHGTYQDVWSSDLISGDAKAVFFMMFGSWLGEWDSADNIMRAALATRSMGLTCSWAGRPHWYYHHMALGEPIGFSARLTMNNGGLYRNQVNGNARGVHIALMGDPTLRAHPVAPFSGFGATAVSGGVRLNWNASGDSVLGYHVYRSDSAGGPYTRLTGSPVAGTAFTDSSANGSSTYMVRAVKLENTPSGSYFNQSQGVFIRGEGSGPGPEPPPPPPPPADLPVVNVVATDPYGAEAGRETAAIQINRSGSTASALTVRLSMSGSAVNGTDYESVASSLIIPAGSSSGLVVIRPIDDPIGEESESVTVTLTANSAYKIGSVNSVTGFLSDNDEDNPPPPVNDPSPPVPDPLPPVTNTTRRVKTVWVDDALPAGAIRGSDGGDRWNWVEQPRFAGKLAHRSTARKGHHQHFFNYATKPLIVRSGDVLFAYVYLDPTNPPDQVMLQWNDGSWEHRAYWGRSMNSFGIAETDSRRHMGPLPRAGRWVRLEVPARLVGLEGRTLTGMAFTLYGGRATWDQAGKFSRK